MDIGNKPEIYIDSSLLINEIGSLEIFKAFCSNLIKENQLFRSELRSDKRKTCNVYFDYKKQQYVYNDFADKKLSCIEYVIEKYHCDFKTALKLIMQHFKYNITKQAVAVKQESKTKKNFIIRIKEREFNSYDYNYWKQFGISLDNLKEENIKAVDKFWYGYESLKINVCSKIYGTYSYEHGNEKRDIYSPYKNEYGKWFKNHGNIIYGLTKLDKKGKNLFIATSQKDRLCLKYALGYKNVIAPTNESAFISKEIIENLKSRFENIIIVPDWDSPGLKQAVIKSFYYQCKYVKICISLKNRTNTKDVAELYSTNSKLCREFINQEINKLI